MITVPPSRHLQEFLEEANLNAAQLAAALQVPRNRVTRILNNTCAISLEMALRLGHFFGQSAQFWLNLQAQYDQALAANNGLTARVQAEVKPLLVH